MRFRSIVLALALAACAATPPGVSRQLAPADAATALFTGAGLRMSVSAPRAGADGADPLILMRLAHADGRVMAFEEANHTPNDLMAQAPDGPLAQVMGLFGGEQPTLYTARPNEHRGAPFLCGPEGPAAIGYYADEQGGVQIVGLKRMFQFEPDGMGGMGALPYSPDQVCARLRLRLS